MTQYEHTIGGFPVTIKVKDLGHLNYGDDEVDYLYDEAPPEPIVERIADALARGEHYGGLMVHELPLVFAWVASEPS
jgi:hypothetical protein